MAVSSAIHKRLPNPSPTPIARPTTTVWPDPDILWNDDHGGPLPKDGGKKTSPQAKETPGWTTGGPGEARGSFYSPINWLGLQPLGLVEVLDWTAVSLDRVDRPAFFAHFSEGDAVPYFYEPFLEAFDPDLRKQLGVWYTPVEVVRYMVARVDRALKNDLDIADDLSKRRKSSISPTSPDGSG